MGTVGMDGTSDGHKAECPKEKWYSHLVLEIKLSNMYVIVQKFPLATQAQGGDHAFFISLVSTSFVVDFFCQNNVAENKIQ